MVSLFHCDFQVFFAFHFVSWEDDSQCDFLVFFFFILTNYVSLCFIIFGSNCLRFGVVTNLGVFASSHINFKFVEWLNFFCKSSCFLHFLLPFSIFSILIVFFFLLTLKSFWFPTCIFFSCSRLKVASEGS